SMGRRHDRIVSTTRVFERLIPGNPNGVTVNSQGCQPLDEGRHLNISPNGTTEFSRCNGCGPLLRRVIFMPQSLACLICIWSSPRKIENRLSTGKSNRDCTSIWEES